MSNSISVEFYGTARLDMQLKQMSIERSDELTLGKLLREVESRVPHADGKMLADSELAPGLLANLDGNSFTSDLDQDLSQIDSVLIMSIDVGG